MTYEHYIVQGVITAGPAAGSKVFLVKGRKVQFSDAYTREQRHAGVYTYCPEDPGLADDPAAVLEEVKAAQAGQPVEWTMERVDPNSKGRI